MCVTAKKGSEAKLYPVTDITIEKALMFAKRKNDSAGVNTILTQKTIDSLNTTVCLFRMAMVSIYPLLQFGVVTNPGNEKNDKTMTLLFWS